MDPDDFSINSTNSTDETYSNNEYERSLYARLILELFTLVGLISVVTNFLIVFVIVKFKKLRQDVTNILVVHWNILQAAYLFFAPLTLRVAMMLDFTTRLHLTVFCVANEIEYAVLFAICMFQALLVCDWYIKLYHENTYTKFCRVYKFVVVFIYISSICLCATTVQFSCQGFMQFTTLLVVLAANILFLVFVIIMNIIHAVKKRKLGPNNKNNVGLVIANLFWLLWCPSLLTIFLAFFRIHSTIALIVTTTLGFSHPIFCFFYFFYYDNRFNIFLKKVIKCKCNDYDNEDLEDQSVTYNDANGVQIKKNEESVDYNII